MIVDSSALLAVIFNEPDEERMSAAMIDAPVVRMSAANWLEAAIVVNARGNPYVEVRFNEMVEELGMEIVAVPAYIAGQARLAHISWDRGNHPAGLNYGDCFAYALAKTSGEPLLFKGNDFSRTDINAAA